ncbi:MAG: hypothetical protein HW387_1490 [Parachlamydiales bacterium]|nr:hypothetical protein [Parachlamydiales bacterium]
MCYPVPSIRKPSDLSSQGLSASGGLSPLSSPKLSLGDSTFSSKDILRSEDQVVSSTFQKEAKSGVQGWSKGKWDVSVREDMITVTVLSVKSAWTKAMEQNLADIRNSLLTNCEISQNWEAKTTEGLSFTLVKKKPKKGTLLARITMLIKRLFTAKADELTPQVLNDVANVDNESNAGLMGKFLDAKFIAAIEAAEKLSTGSSIEQIRAAVDATECFEKVADVYSKNYKPNTEQDKIIRLISQQLEESISTDLKLIGMIKPIPKPVRASYTCKKIVQDTNIERITDHWEVTFSGSKEFLKELLSDIDEGSNLDQSDFTFIGFHKHNLPFSHSTRLEYSKETAAPWQFKCLFQTHDDSTRYIHWVAKREEEHRNLKKNMAHPFEICTVTYDNCLYSASGQPQNTTIGQFGFLPSDSGE